MKKSIAEKVRAESPRVARRRAEPRAKAPVEASLPAGSMASQASGGDRRAQAEAPVPRRKLSGEVLDRLGDQADRPMLLCGHTHLQRAMATLDRMLNET